MRHPLASAYLKLQRGQEHFASLRTALVMFRDSQRDRVSVEVDPGTGEKSWTVSELIDEPPPIISLIIGDVVHNARSALDHLANALVESSGSRPTTRTQFPISESPKKFHARAGEQTKGMSPGIVRVVELSQPYKRTTRPTAERHPLHLLHTLDIADKHRQLHTAVATVYSRIALPGEDRLTLDLLEPDAELQRVPSLDESEVRPIVEVVFLDGPASDEPVLWVLSDILSEVRLVLERFRERFYQSAGGELPNVPDPDSWRG